MSSVWKVIFAGAFATVMIDVWALMLDKVFKLPVTNWGMVGRWFAYMPKGRFIHKPIKDSAPIQHESAIGWTAHYLIGLIYAYWYFAIVLPALNRGPALLSAVVFSLVMIGFPWMVMQPGLGMGMFARLTGRGNVIRAINLSIHIIFGAALYVGWGAASQLAVGG